MATLITGLGGTSGYGEQSFKTTGGYTGSLDDGSKLVDISGVFGSGGIDVYGTRYTSIYINTNGLITFSSANASYTPGALTTLGQPSLAPFWTDIDIAKGGDIYWDLDASTGKVTVTWLNVAPYSGSGTLSFQLVLTNLGGGDFGVDYIYNNIGFTNGYAGQATVGMSNGTTSQILLEGSGDAAFLATYAGNDFDTNDPAGVFSLQSEAGAVFLGDGVVDGSAGADLIDSSYVGDPDGDRIDANDATGYAGTTGQADYVQAGAGHDTVVSGLGNDVVYGGTGNDVVNAGVPVTLALDGGDPVDAGSALMIMTLGAGKGDSVEVSGDNQDDVDAIAAAYAAAGSRSPWPLETELRGTPGTSSITRKALPSSSPMTASSGRSSPSRRRISSWLRWSISVTGSVSVDFDVTRRSAGRSSTTSRPAARATRQATSSSPARSNRNTFSTLALTKIAEPMRASFDPRTMPQASSTTPSPSQTAEYAYHSVSLVGRRMPICAS